MFKILLILALLLSPFQNSFSEGASKIDSYLQEKIQEINKIPIQNYCIGDEWKTQLSNWSHSQRDYSNLSNLISSFAAYFKWNACLTKDYVKIIEIIELAYNKWLKLSKSCANKNPEWSKNLEEIEKIISELKNLEINFWKREDKYYWDEEFYWEKSIKCKEDWWQKIGSKWDKLKEKIVNLSSWKAFELNTNIDTEKAKKQWEANAKSWILKTIDSYVWSFWFRSYFKWNDTPSIEESWNDNMKIDRKKNNLWQWIDEKFIPWKDISQTLQEIQDGLRKKAITDFNLETISKHDLINYQKESTNDYIENELWRLEALIIRSDWTKQDLIKINKNWWGWFDTNNIDSLRKFIELVWQKLKQHNKNESRWPSFECGNETSWCDWYNFD